MAWRRAATLAETNGNACNGKGKCVCMCIFVSEILKTKIVQKWQIFSKRIPFCDAIQYLASSYYSYKESPPISDFSICLRFAVQRESQRKVLHIQSNAQSIT